MKIKKKTKILITGGSGYIGSCLSFLSRTYEILTIDKMRKSKFVNLKINHKVVDLKNKSEIDKIIKIFNPNVIIHLAGQSTIDMVNKKKIVL